MKERTVRAHLNYLEHDLGIIKREHRRGEDGRWTSDGYLLLAPTDSLSSSEHNGRQNMPPVKSAVSKKQPTAISAANTKDKKDDTKDPPTRLTGSRYGTDVPDTEPTEFSILGYLQFLSHQPAYDHIDPVIEESKISLWHQLPANRRRSITKGFLQNWVKRIDRPLPERSTGHGCDGRTQTGGRGDQPQPGGRMPGRIERIERTYAGRDYERLVDESL
jgi:hypothetical protein